MQKSIFKKALSCLLALALQVQNIYTLKVEM